MCNVSMEDIDARLARLKRNIEQISAEDMPKYKKALDSYTDGVLKDTVQLIRENTQKDDTSELSNMVFYITLNIISEDLVPGVKYQNMDNIWTAYANAVRWYPIIKCSIEEWDLRIVHEVYTGKEATDACIKNN